MVFHGHVTAHPVAAKSWQPTRVPAPAEIQTTERTRLLVLPHAAMKQAPGAPESAGDEAGLSDSAVNPWKSLRSVFDD